MMQIARIHFLCKTTFYEIQKKYIFQAIHKIYSTHRELRFQSYLEGNEALDLAGDKRCDSPGYSAKYGTYTLLNSKSNEIVDFHVVHVGQVGNSSRMEKQGLIVVLNRLLENQLSIEGIATDRHVQIRKYMREERKDIKHHFDVWHMGKNIKRKLVKCSKKTTAKDLLSWVKAVINHFWWCCASGNGNVVELREKWLSLLCHVKNKHKWESNKIYHKCEHSKLSKLEQRSKKWLMEGAPAYKALESVVRAKSLLRDLKYFVEFKHTGNLEVYHSLYNKYCPKRLHFSFAGMIARSQLAVLDFNAGAGSSHAQTSSGEHRYKQQYSRITDSWVVKKVYTEKQRSYVEDIVSEVKYLVRTKEGYAAPNVADVPNYIAPREKPDKKEAIENMKTRFTL
ncbi:uncharacterized protein LOC130647027 [Hydractinia symbiolongicarpus]|uniref:uncharacterized protein LOC130647027 n=1 Tax=Hydractinia symbiolongicarpus TaxID=13093 RepID=UPI00254C3F5F|nr:uncharacterized protein LOC130647027 [Hydractinia symbiolongicarpus]